MSIPESTALIELAATHSLPQAPLVSALLALLDQYGAIELQQAINEALEKERPSASAVEQILVRRRDEQQRPPPIPVALPPTMNRYGVRPASLAAYDTLNPSQETDHDRQSDTKQEPKTEPD